MESDELSTLEQRLLLELYLYEMDNSGEVIPTDQLLNNLGYSTDDLKFAFRKLGLKGLLLGQSMTVRGKLFVEENGLLSITEWSKVQAIRDAISLCVVETMVAENISESVTIDELTSRLQLKLGLLVFNLDVMAERGYLTILRGNRVGLGPRLRALVSKRA